MLKHPSTHTQYAHSRRKQQTAINNILNLRRFLFVDQDVSKTRLQQKMLDNIEAYLVPVVLEKSPLQTQINALKNNTALRSEQKQSAIRQRQTRLDQYSQRYALAVQIYKQHRIKIIDLTIANNVYLAHEVKHNQYLYMLDEETSRHLCLADNKTANCHCFFTDKHDIQLINDQTDAIRVWRNNMTLSQLTIRDRRVYRDIAHRDAIQLIPPPLYEERGDENNRYRVKLADQMAGTILENISISHCNIQAPKGALQGIFASDGMCRNLHISDTTIATKGAHSISIAGALTGCKIKNITLQQVKGGNLPEISLYPLRIGGNMADDGLIYIFSFSAKAEFHYGAIETQNNKRYRWGETEAEDIEINDFRQKIPRRYLKMALGLNHFDYAKYFQEYTQWTIADFKRELPQQFANMSAWIDLRVSEYSSGKRIPEVDNPLAPPSAEQTDPKKQGVLDMLKQAQNALNQNSAAFNNTRLPEVAQTAIRSFVMKCIALRNGQVQPLYNLTDQANKIRQASLRFLLAKKHFLNLQKNPEQYNNVRADVEAIHSTTVTAVVPVEPFRPTISNTEDFINSVPHIITHDRDRVPRGEDIVFELDTIYENVSYFWLFGNYQSTERQISKANRLVLHTTAVNVGEHQQVRVVISDRKRNQIHLKYYFDVLPAAKFELES